MFNYGKLRQTLFTMNANFPRNFSVKSDAVWKTSTIVLGANYRSFLSLLETAVSKVENGGFLQNTARFYSRNFRV